MRLPRWRENRGAVAVTVASMLVVLLAFGSLAVDVGYLMVIRNQLQNAADAGALAATRVLYNDYGTEINVNCNQVGYDTAVANYSQGQPVEVAGDLASNAGDIQRGHWSFATRTFTPNDSTEPVDLWDVPTSELDANLDFINAVRVRVRRENIPAHSFLARVIGLDNFQVQAEAVGYIGFAGTLGPGEIDQPIAICKQAVVDPDTGAYTCNTGRMINSGGGTTHNTGGWTNFSQPCQTASAQSVRPLVCAEGNPSLITLGAGMGTVGGMQDSVYSDLRSCWINNPDLAKNPDGKPKESWNMSLPVIDCPANNVSPCSEVVGAVNLDMLWIKQSGADPQFTDIPLQMSAGDINWSCSLGGRIQTIYGDVSTLRARDLTFDDRVNCWNEFATAFNLRTADGTSVGTLTHSELQKTIFFRPDCTPHELKGRTGGENFGVLAKIPVLVE